MHIVECVEVNKTYKQGQVTVQALKGVCLQINKGEFLAVAGPSGSGKTTLLNMIGGLDRIDSGSIFVDGEAFENMSQSQLAHVRLHKIGFVFQAYNLIPVFTARENVEFIMLLQGVDKNEREKRAKELLNQVGLKDRVDTQPSKLSGGEQQRVAVARALASKPAFVLAD